MNGAAQGKSSRVLAGSGGPQPCRAEVWGMRASRLQRLAAGLALAIGLGSCSSAPQPSPASASPTTTATGVRSVEAVPSAEMGSCSMFPALRPGDRLRLEPIVGALHRGDIVSHEMPPPPRETQ